MIKDFFKRVFKSVRSCNVFQSQYLQDERLVKRTLTLMTDVACDFVHKTFERKTAETVKIEPVIQTLKCDVSLNVSSVPTPPPPPPPPTSVL